MVEEFDRTQGSPDCTWLGCIDVITLEILTFHRKASKQASNESSHPTVVSNIPSMHYHTELGKVMTKFSHIVRGVLIDAHQCPSAVHLSVPVVPSTGCKKAAWKAVKTKPGNGFEIGSTSLNRFHMPTAQTIQ